MTSVTEIFKEIIDSARKQLLLDFGQSSWPTVLLRLPQPRFIASEARVTTSLKDGRRGYVVRQQCALTATLQLRLSSR